MPNNSTVIALMVCAFWGIYFYFSQLFGTWNTITVFQGTPFESVPLCFDSSELPTITIYALYIPIFIQWMKKAKGQGFFKRYLLPSVSIACCAFMIFAAVYAHGITPYLAAKEKGQFSFPVLFYCIVFAVIMGLGALVKNPRKEQIITE